MFTLDVCSPSEFVDVFCQSELLAHRLTARLCGEIPWKCHASRIPPYCQFANRLGGRAWKYFYKLKHEEEEAQANGGDEKLRFNPFLQNIFLLILGQLFMLSLLQNRDSNQYSRRQEKKVFSSLNQQFSAASSRSCAESETY